MKQEITRYVIVDLDTGEFLRNIDYATYCYRWSFTPAISQARFGLKKDLNLLLESRFSVLYPGILPKEVKFAKLEVREVKVTYEY